MIGLSAGTNERLALSPRLAVKLLAVILTGQGPNDRGGRRVIELHEFAPAWGINPGPFCLKVEAYLRLTLGPVLGRREVRVELRVAQKE